MPRFAGHYEAHEAIGCSQSAHDRRREILDALKRLDGDPVAQRLWILWGRGAFRHGYDVGYAWCLMQGPHGLSIENIVAELDDAYTVNGCSKIEPG